MLAATLTTVVVFFPVTFLYGVSKFLFSALALAVVISLFASYFVAMTVIPLFCSRFLKHAPHAEGHGQKAGGGTGVPPVTGTTGTAVAPSSAGTHQTPSWGERFNAGFNRMFGKLLDYYEYWVRRALVRPGLDRGGFGGGVLGQPGHLPFSGLGLLPPHRRRAVHHQPQGAHRHAH